MRKWSIYSIAAILTVLILNKGNTQYVTLLKTTQLEHYPSASGIAFNNGKLYIIGDDATKLLVLNTDHIPVDSVTIFPHNGKRIPYTIKPDLESLTIGAYKGQFYLIAIPSFSSENRNTVYAFPLVNINKFHALTEPHPINQLKKIGIQEPNLEGAAVINKKVVFSNRANQAQPLNYLVTIPVKKRSLKKTNGWQKTAIDFPDAGSIIGVSGLEYCANTDMLLFTASTEATSSATADGAIGESYIGYINDLKQKSKSKSITPDRLINLSKELKIGNQKIEGLCVESVTKNQMILHLVADNDNGQSIIYKVQFDFNP